MVWFESQKYFEHSADIRSGVVLSVARSNFAGIAQLMFMVLNAIGLALGTIYSNKTPDLYPNNSHSKIGWILTLIVVAQTIIITGSGSRRKQPTMPLSVEAMARHHARTPDIQDDAGYPHASRQGEDMASPRNNSMSGTTDCEEDNSHQRQDYHDSGSDWDFTEEKGLLDHSAVDRVLSRLPLRFLQKALRYMDISRDLIDYIVLLLGFFGITTGIVVYGGIFRGSSIFNGLAHFVKGGIFFWYGLITLGRWMGCWSEIGWAWNLKPPVGMVSTRKARTPSAEFVESFVIFLYGSTNVFLEHLAAWGDRWTAQDLEHVSISIMFFGGGLCGMLVESRRVRDLLNTTILTSPANRSKPAINQQWATPKSYGTSLNPFPGLIILLLGLMMSSHHQDSMVSTMVHKQWGTLFVGFALARAVTYLLMYLSPPSSYLPSRPPSEIITSFCLISGGLIFMASNKNTVAAMEHYDLDAMFIFTVTMGLTAFLMAWTILVLALKGWAARRNQPSRFAVQPSTA